MEHLSNWKNKESYEERQEKRKDRILIVSLSVLTLAVLTILFSLIHSQVTTQQATTATTATTSAATDTSADSSAAESSDNAAIPDQTSGLLVSFLDVGQGDSIFLRSPSGKTMLIDGGPEGSFSVIDAYLSSLGVVGLDVVVASHLHADHIGGLVSLVDTYAIGDFYYPNFDATSEVYFELLDALNESQAVVHRPYAETDTMIPWDDSVEVQILAPYETIYDDFNDTSYIIRVKYGNTAVLLMGDATQTSEKLALKAQPNQNFKADIIKISHHGSSDGTLEEFLDVVSPAIAVISCGANNDYGHPHQSVLDMLLERGITIYRTDLNGTITMLLDGTSVTVIE